MKINWKVRSRNPMFWMTIIPAMAAFAYSMLSAFDITPGISEDAVVNAFTSIITGLSMLGVLVDPTTTGVTDSNQAMTYETPNGG